MKRLSTNEELKKIHLTILESKLMLLDEMAGLNNRSAFVRDLIDREYERRQAMKETPEIREKRI